MYWLWATLLSLAAATQTTDWSLEKEYSYTYTSSLLSGIPQLGKQFAGLKLATIIKIQKYSDESVRLKFENSKFKSYNEEIEDVIRSPLSPRVEDGELDVPEAIKIHLETPFKVVTNEGLVEKIQCEDSEPEYITNIKKAAVSRLMDLSHSKLTEEIENTRSGQKTEEFQAYITNMETSIVGECDAIYTITKMPEYLAMEFEEKEHLPNKELCTGKDYYEVIKTKDLKRCKERPIYLHLYGARSISDGSLGSSAPFTEESSLSRGVICGRPDSFILRKITNQHSYTISPTGKFENIEKMVVSSSSIISLRSIEDKTEQIPDVRSPKARGSLIYEFPGQDTFGSTSSMKTLLLQHRQEDTNQDDIDWYTAQIPLPDLVSVPYTLYPTTTTVEEDKEELVRAFLKIVENAGKSPESSYSAEDVSGVAVMFTEALGRLGLEDIKALWTKIDPRLPHDGYVKENAYSSFLDLVSTCGTNPCVKYIIDVIWGGKIHLGQFNIKGESGAWIISNVIRSIKTPTEELLGELTMLLKHSYVQGHRKIASTLALGLTNLINKACIHRTSSLYDFPVKTYGRFCDEKSRVITRELIPFLAEKLFETPETDHNKMLIYINALGNLGHNGAAIHLLKVIEGHPSRHPLPRSLAVYQLFKTAYDNPTLYRPVLLNIIKNVAESDQVRMAAITILPYTKPTSVVYNQLAISTWWEPSRQVSSYFASTVKTISKLPQNSRIYSTVFGHTEQAARLVRPSDAGIETSHNFLISEFLEALKSSVNMKVQYVVSEESAFPRNTFIRSTVDSKTHNTNNFQSEVYFEGAEYLINKLYATFAPQEESGKKDYIKNIIRVTNRKMRKPEAHLNLKLVGLQRLFSANSEMIDELIENIAKDNIASLARDMNTYKDFLKIIDVNGHNAIIPTECGLPLYISHKTPLVVSGKASLDIKDKEISLIIKPIINYKLSSQAGIFSPFSRKFLGTGVDTSLHLALPIKVELSNTNGQYTTILSTPQDEESQKKKPLIHLVVKPYTTNYDMTSLYLIPASKSQECKTINTNHRVIKNEYDVGGHLGLNMKLTAETEQPNFHITDYVWELFSRKPLTLLTLSLPLQTVKAHSISLVYSPKESTSKHVSLAFSYGHGNKQSNSQQTTVTTSTRLNVSDHLENSCRSGRDEEGKQVCIREAMASLEKEKCLKEQSRQSRPSSEIEVFCSRRALEYKQMHFATQSMKNDLTEMMNMIHHAGQSTSVNMEASLHAQDYSVVDKLQAQVTAANKKISNKNEDQEVKIKASLKTPGLEKPYDIYLHSSLNLKEPKNKWNKDALLDEDITSRIQVSTNFGIHNEHKDTITLDITASRSEEQKAYVEDSEASRKCDLDINQGRLITNSCRKARHDAASLDQVQAILGLPTWISRSHAMTTVSNLIKLYNLPYLKVEHTGYNRHSANHEHYKVVGRVSSTGESVTVSVAHGHVKTILTDLRLGTSFVGLLPICTKDSLPSRLVEKLTNYGAPSTCSVENNKVTTFDKVTFDYELNDCEHVIFKDCSDSPKVLVTVQKTQTENIVKVVVDNNEYKLELAKGSQGFRGDIGTVKVNDVVKESDHDIPANYEDKDNKITRFEDGVFEIFSSKYGLSIRADSERTEVKSFQQNFRNIACGLCGDLNDEKTGDVSSAQECVMSSPRLAAYSYMVQNNQCSGIPEIDQHEYSKDTSRCVKKNIRISEVLNIFHRQSRRTARGAEEWRKHLDQDLGDKICISKEQMRMCDQDSQPTVIIPREIAFFCVPKDREGKRLQKMARRGEVIEQAQRHHTEYSSTVYEPRSC